MSSLISEFFDLLVAIAVAFVISHLCDRPMQDVMIVMTFGYAVLVNNRTRSK